ncbi:MAG TPA: hypothetical protein VGA47_07780 [Candidatus Dormibacteraeota bacterium]
MQFRDLVRRRRMVRRFQPTPPIGVLGIGYPRPDSFDPARFAARRRSLESMVHVGRW